MGSPGKIQLVSVNILLDTIEFRIYQQVSERNSMVLLIGISEH